MSHLSISGFFVLHFETQKPQSYKDGDKKPKDSNRKTYNNDFCMSIMHVNYIPLIYLCLIYRVAQKLIHYRTINILHKSLQIKIRFFLSNESVTQVSNRV